MKLKPNNKTVWEVDGNNMLTPNTPVKLKWTNNSITFGKIIKLDDKFLFSIEQKITTKFEKRLIIFILMVQVIRNTAPEVTNFYILHEGLLGVFDDDGGRGL